MDLIDRRVAIDAMAELQGRASTKAELKGISKAWKRIKQLPPIQPEIIRCKDCQHSEYDAMYGDRYCHHNGKAEIVPDNHYCGYGERRTNVRSD